MATFIVNTDTDVVADDGKLSLREAVNQANASTTADTILFTSAVQGQRIVLSGSQLTVRSDIVIDGGIGVAIDGDGRSRVLLVEASGSDATLNHVEIAGGWAPSEAGGGIYLGNDTSMTLLNCNVHNNYAGGHGGGIAGERGTELSIVSSVIAENSAQFIGGGVFLYPNERNAVALSMQGSSVSDNNSIHGTGGVFLYEGRADIQNSSIIRNTGKDAGGIEISSSDITLSNCTIAENLGANVGGIAVRASTLSVTNSVITANIGVQSAVNIFGIGGIQIANSHVDLANSVVAGNAAQGSNGTSNIAGTIAISNGHNLFGSAVSGAVSGDRVDVAPATIFAALDPDTGGGLLSTTGIIPLLNSKSNPALSGAGLLEGTATGQLGTTVRPLPAGSLPDVGSIEINQALSTTASTNNDVLTGTGSANTIRGLDGADYLKGLGGNDTLYGGKQGDLLDGGTGNDKLYGDAGIDLVFYGGGTKVKVDLSLATDKAIRGTEVDTLYNVEGAIGSDRGDVFIGNQYNNYFRGGLGKDIISGGSGHDRYDFNSVVDSPVGAVTRDLIKDLDLPLDKIDVMGIDADATVAGNQAFDWVGTAALSGPGEVGYFTSGGDTIVQANTDADSAAEFQIQLNGLKALTAMDFYL